MSIPGSESVGAGAASTGLAGQLRQESEAMRAALAEFGLAPQSYGAILADGEAVVAKLRAGGFVGSADRLMGLLRGFGEALESPSSDPERRGRAYLALLESVLMRSVVGSARGPRWLEALEARVGTSGGAAHGGLGLLTIAGLCQRAGAKVTPSRAGAMAVEWQGWRFGLVGAAPVGASGVEGAVESGSTELGEVRMPGLVVVDLAEQVCPEQRPLRAVQADAGGEELRRRLDAVLQRSREAITSRCNRDFVLGVVGWAFLAIHLVPAGQVAFMTGYRFMSLLDPADPREAKLRTFRSKFGGVGG